MEAAEPLLPNGAEAFTAQLLAGARTTDHNAFKPLLVTRVLSDVLQETGRTT
jgi:xanthine dehydrogenase YagS FAD-binding subunit